MEKLLLAFSICLLPSYFLHAQNYNITLAGQLTYPTQSLSNIHGWVDTADGKEYALVGAADGLSIVDVSNPASPVEIAQIPVPPSSSGCIWREVKTWGDYAYITTECGTMGLQIVELTNLPATNLSTATWTPVIGTDTLKTIHALHIDNGKIYLYGGNLPGCKVADVGSTPMSPVYLGSYINAIDPYIHDGYVRNDTMYAAHISAGTVEIVNMANPASGVALASFSTPNAFTHNTWLSADSKTCFTTDEVDDSYLAAFNISNLTNIFETDRIQSNPGSNSVVHNTHIVSKNSVDYAVTSWDKDGLTIVDANRPNNLVQVGNYDTSPLSGGGFGGCWGVYPYLPSGIVVASDRTEGLFVLTPTYVRACYLEGTVTDCINGIPISGVDVTIQLASPQSDAHIDVTDAMGKYEVGVVAAGTYTVTVSKTGYLSQTFTVAVTTGNVTTLNVVFCATGIDESTYNNSNLSIYPNPFSASTTIDFIGHQSSVIGSEFKLYDVFGREALLLPVTDYRFLITRGNLPSGIYFYRIISLSPCLPAGTAAGERRGEVVIATGKIIAGD